MTNYSTSYTAGDRRTASHFIVEQWEVPSDSNPKLVYRISLDANGDYSCGCKGWTMHTPRRDCKHIAVVRAGLGRSLDPLLTQIVKAQHRAKRAAARSAVGVAH